MSIPRRTYAAVTYGCSAFIISIGSLYITRYIGGVDNFSSWFFALKVAISLIAVYLLFKLLHIVINSSSPEKRKWGLTVIVLIMLMILTEAGFMFVARSFAINYALADQNWMRKYWNPINSMGYRGANIDKAAAESKKNILVVGASYVAGVGIERIEDRFTERLGAKLPDDYLVHNMGRSGSEICDAFKRMDEYMVQPDMLILGHTARSIKALMDADRRKGPDFNLPEQLHPAVGFFVKGSYFLNYLFWKFYAPSKLMQLYVANMKSMPLSLYLREDKLVQHYYNIQKFVDYCRERSIPLIVILFPSMASHIDLTEDLVCKPVKDYLVQRNVFVLDVYHLVKDMPAQQRTVNSNDMHPSAAVHARIADELFRTMKQHNLIPGK